MRRKKIIFPLPKRTCAGGEEMWWRTRPFDARLVHFIYRPPPLLCKWKYILFICASHIFNGCHTAAATAPIISTTAAAKAEYRYFFFLFHLAAHNLFPICWFSFSSIHPAQCWAINVFGAVFFFFFFMLGLVNAHRSIHVAPCLLRLTFHVQHVIFCLLLFSFRFIFLFDLILFTYFSSERRFLSFIHYMVWFAHADVCHWCVVACCRTDFISKRVHATFSFLLFILDTNL